MILRMLGLHMQEWWSMKKLLKSLETFASIMATEDPTLDARGIMAAWALRMWDMITKLSKVDHLNSSALKVTIGRAILARGSKYSLGNPAIAHGLKYWVEREKAKQPEQVTIFIHFYWFKLVILKSSHLLVLYRILLVITIQCST